MITEEIFYNKELCDALRCIAVNSPLKYKEALVLLRRSKDYTRDVPLIKKLSTSGVHFKQIHVFISAINS